MRLDAAVLAVLFLFLLWVMHRQQRSRIRALRGAIFDACLPLMTQCRLEQDDVNFPILTGIYRGYQFKVEPLVDHAAYRKIPSLWLMVTLSGELPLKGAFDLLVRPQNVEFFSPFWDMPASLPVPEGWPAHALIKTSGAAEIPWVSLLEPHVRTIFADPRAKELLVTPRGVRIVYQAGQADRGQYLVLRSAVFGRVSLEPELFRRLLDWAISVHAALDQDLQVPQASCL